LDILFVGLNPAKGSNDNRHYFSVNQAFWNQLFEAELITQPVNKQIADDIVFGGNNLNFDNWEYGITDLVTEYAESDSRKIAPTSEHCRRLIIDVEKFKPKAVVLLHGKVISNLCTYIGKNIPKANTGQMGQLIENCKTEFFNIAFPHGNTISTVKKVARYLELKKELLKLD
jgi:hypothetical protein